MHIRLWIISSIERILAGEGFTRLDWDQQPNDGWKEIQSPKAMFSSHDYPAHSAWIQLQQWVNDDDIRAKDPTYGPMRMKYLEDVLVRIKDQTERK